MSTDMVSFDLDSSIYNTRPRHHMIDRINGTNWSAYGQACMVDLPGPAWYMARHYSALQIPFIIVSARHEDARDVTLQKLHQDEIYPWAVYLCDDRHDYMSHGKWKAMRILEVAEKNNWNILFHVEDVTEVAIECEAAGIPTMLVHDIESNHQDFLG